MIGTEEASGASRDIAIEVVSRHMLPNEPDWSERSQMQEGEATGLGGDATYEIVALASFSQENVHVMLA